MSDTHKANFAADINDSLIANINHALRTPLNGVVGMINLLAKTGLNKNQLKYAHVVQESTESLMLQLDNIVELAKIEGGEYLVQPQKTRLKDIVKEALQPLIVASVKKGIPLSVEYSFDLPEFIETDPHKLRLVLTNLLSCSLKFAERGKVVLKVIKERFEIDGEERFKLRFSLENSKVLYDALHGSIASVNDAGMPDLQEFGEITVSLLTTQKLLNVMGADICFDHLKAGHEPPFHFDLALVPCEREDIKTHYSVLENKRALVFENDVLELNTLTQSLRLWDIDARFTSDQDAILEDVDAAYREGRAFHLLFICEPLEGRMLAQLKEKVAHVVMIADKATKNKAWLDEFAAHLVPPVYPQELLAALSAFYKDAAPEYEAHLSHEASKLVHHADLEPVKANVMVVEDDFVSRLYAAELLEGFGCKVATAENGHQAVTRLLKHADYDVIFMDCMMPQMDGYNATRQLRDAGLTDIPIIALTANTMEKDRDKCLQAGMNDYITKPVREQDLHDMLKKHVKKAKK